MRLRLAPVLTPFFRAWWRLRRPMTLGVRALVCDSEGRVLLVRHGYAHGWHLPGGGVEHGETAIEAVVREAAEEGGAKAVGTPELLGFYANHANFPNDHIAFYRIATWRPCDPQGGFEIAERGFFDPGAPPEGATPGTVRRLREVFAGAPRSASW
ncbi:MAG: NUDIX domain-containing protein [Hyphomonadaceae bacterium]|nr:NUDIX domain-containing protein [Hyphomonadaceae bacterium]MBX3509931.1 NUDIX domain-containing protein [Hyphomonadaceae bacterium]